MNKSWSLIFRIVARNLSAVCGKSLWAHPCPITFDWSTYLAMNAWPCCQSITDDGDNGARVLIEESAGFIFFYYSGSMNCTTDVVYAFNVILVSPVIYETKRNMEIHDGAKKEHAGRSSQGLGLDLIIALRKVCPTHTWSPLMYVSDGRRSDCRGMARNAGGLALRSRCDHSRGLVVDIRYCEGLYVHIFISYTPTYLSIFGPSPGQRNERAKGR